jgi:membrane protein involved in colicin uptake
MANARLAVQQAEGTEAPREAPLEMQQARDKLTEAEKAVVAEDYVAARRLAQEAAADALYAQAKAERAVADRNRQQVESAIGALSNSRSTGGTGSPGTSPMSSTGSTAGAPTTATPLAPPASGGMQ